MLVRIIVIFVFLHNFTHGVHIVKYATVIYRHGDRTPVNCYPNDPYKNESLWPVPFGQLTNIGKEQHFKLGKYLRKRFSDILSKKYNPKEINIKSTDVDRTLMSAEANLAGMYPPFAEEIWNKYLFWQPIPVHTTPERHDEILAMKKHCQKYENEKKKYITSKSYLEKLNKYKDLMEYLSEYTGMEVRDYEDMQDIYSCLNIDHLYNFTLPKWAESVFPAKLREPAGYSFRISAATPTMARLIVGPLVKQIVGRMQAVVDGTSALKLSIYSGHDFTVGTLLTALGVYDGVCPTYTATIFIELLLDDQQIFENDEDVYNSEYGYYVRLLYRNSVDIVEPTVLTIPGCAQLCPLSEFTKIYSNLITVDWETECNAQDHCCWLVLTSVPCYLYGISIGVIIVLCTAMLVKCMASNRFPQNEIQREKWRLIIIKEERGDEYNPKDLSVVCLDHFSECDMTYYTQKEFRRIRKNAVPKMQNLDT